MLIFVEEVKEVSINDKFLVSSDVNSLFTNIPLKETIKLAVDLIKTSYPNLKISSDNLTKLFKFATCETHFLFNGKFYDQIDGVAMGSPLAPVLANLFRDTTKNSGLKTFRGLHHPTVEDMLMIFFQFLITAMKQKNFLIILIQDTLTLSLPWRLKLIKSFLF